MAARFLPGPSRAPYRSPWIGLAGLSRHTACLELGLGLLKALDVHGSPWMRTWFVAHRRSMPLLPLHARLKAFILAEGRGVVAEMEAVNARNPTPPPSRG